MSTPLVATEDLSVTDPVLFAVLANRFESIVREMTDNLLRAARSSVIAIARDFSCSIVTAGNELVAAAESVPVHLYGVQLQTEAMAELHPGLARGDAYLDNDPYVGNTHAADHTIMVPIFLNGRHCFTACAKAHQGDCGNSVPASSHPLAKDLYEEGALIFSATQIQRDYEDIADIIRLCRRRIRVPDQWFGDYLAMVGAARTAERRIEQLGEKYGAGVLDDFVTAWLDYSERRMRSAIATLPSGAVRESTAHDPFGSFEDGIPVNVALAIDPKNEIIDIDLRDNIDCVPSGVNQTRASVTSAALAGVFYSLGTSVPVNAGSFRRVNVHLRENCVVGIPLHPTPCSICTTHLADRVINCIQHAFSRLGPGHGLPEGGAVIGAGFAKISGKHSGGNESFVNQVIIGSNGGPATATRDGWITYNAPTGAGLVYRDSVEIDEQRYPMWYRCVRILPDSGGPGYRRGGPCTVVEYGPTELPMEIAFSIDGDLTPARGAHGGHAGSTGAAYVVTSDGSEQRTPGTTQLVLQPGELLRGIHGGGGGWGDPRTREPDRVLDDVREGYVSAAAAERTYAVALTRCGDGEIVIDEERTRRLRADVEAHPNAQDTSTSQPVPTEPGHISGEPGSYPKESHK